MMRSHAPRSPGVTMPAWNWAPQAAIEANDARDAAEARVAAAQGEAETAEHAAGLLARELADKEAARRKLGKDTAGGTPRRLGSSTPRLADSDLPCLLPCYPTRARSATHTFRAPIPMPG